jgi:hypothetical protein
MEARTDDLDGAATGKRTHGHCIIIFCTGAGSAQPCLEEPSARRGGGKRERPFFGGLILILRAVSEGEPGGAQSTVGFRFCLVGAFSLPCWFYSFIKPRTD